MSFSFPRAPPGSDWADGSLALIPEGSMLTLKANDARSASSRGTTLTAVARDLQGGRFARPGPDALAVAHTVQSRGLASPGPNDKKVFAR